MIVDTPKPSMTLSSSSSTIRHSPTNFFLCTYSQRCPLSPILSASLFHFSQYPRCQFGNVLSFFILTYTKSSTAQHNSIGHFRHSTNYSGKVCFDCFSAIFAKATRNNRLNLTLLARSTTHLRQTVTIERQSSRHADRQHNR